MPLDSSSYEPMPEGHRRLLVLAEFLETKVPAARFDMQSWSRANEHGCGTAACACGWATTIPEFAALGFRLGEPDDDGREEMRPILWGSHDEWEAVRAFFDLDYDGSDLLFYHMRYLTPPTPHEVAARIRSFVAEHSSARVG